MLWRINEGSNSLSMQFDCELVRAFGDSEEIVFDLVTCAVRGVSGYGFSSTVARFADG
jgi:hypothetical protein